MSLFDFVPPSERLAELQMTVRRIRRKRELGEVAMLVVEGRSDEPSLGRLCELGDDQVFSAGTRRLVEQLIDSVDREPIANAKFAFLIDCDAVGKPQRHSARDDLVVSETCDLEADLIHIGVATRVVADLLDIEHSAAQTLVDRAVGVANPMSVIRRAAHSCGISMKRGGVQLSLWSIPELKGGRWQALTDDLRVNVVARELSWSPAERDQVLAAIATVDAAPTRCLLGKDGLDALLSLVANRSGQARGYTRDSFHSKVRSSLDPGDASSWVVAQRLRRWEQGQSCALLVRASG